MTLQIYHRQLISEIRRRLVGECQARTLKCLDYLSETEIWHRPNEQSNSVGNLVLHLCGNVRQWLFSTLGKQPDIRQRQAEFDARASHDRVSLKNLIQDLMVDTDKILQALTAEDLCQEYTVQGFRGKRRGHPGTYHGALLLSCGSNDLFREGAQEFGCGILCWCGSK